MTGVLEGIKERNEERRKKKEAKIKECAVKVKQNAKLNTSPMITHLRTSSLTSNYLTKTFMEPSIISNYQPRLTYWI